MTVETVKAGPSRGPASSNPTRLVTTTPSIPPPAHWAEGRTPVFVLLVRYPNSVRRRVFLSLSSAERHAARAHELGHAAEILLCKVAPLTAEERVEVLTGMVPEFRVHEEVESGPPTPSTDVVQTVEDEVQKAPPRPRRDGRRNRRRRS